MSGHSTEISGSLWPNPVLLRPSPKRLVVALAWKTGIGPPNAEKPLFTLTFPQCDFSERVYDLWVKFSSKPCYRAFATPQVACKAAVAARGDRKHVLIPRCKRRASRLELIPTALKTASIRFFKTHRYHPAGMLGRANRGERAGQAPLQHV